VNTLTRSQTKSRRPVPARRAVLGAIAAGLVLGTAACGSAVAGQSNPANPDTKSTRGSQVNPGGPLLPATRSAVCAAIPQLSRLTFTRTLQGVPSRDREVLPLGFTLRDPAAVRQVATLLCGLPTMPPGMMSCPNLNGGSYQIFFVAPGKSFKSVAVQLSGCRTVTGLGLTRTWARSPHVEDQLAQLFAKHHPLHGLEPPPA
jgi:hypothetical protein